MKIGGIEVRDADDTADGSYFLVLISPQGGDDYFELTETPPRTVGNREIKLRGPLGSWNNVARVAQGAVEIYRDSSGRTRHRRVEADDLLRSPGRPARSTDGASMARVELRLTEAEKDRLRNLAKAEGVDVSSYVRKRIF